MIQSINLRYPSKKLYFLIHGYTGSLTDFNEFPEYLHKTYGADVKIVLLKGHGTKIEDLDNLEYDDFLQQIENELKKSIKKYDEVVIGGVSFGAQLALILASRYPVQGVFNVCVPYKLKFPFNVPYLQILGHFKKYWKKSISGKEQELRRNAFHYKDMHIKGLKIVKQANRELGKALPNIKCPILTIHSIHDPIGNYRVIRAMKKKTNTLHVMRIFNDKNHNLFFTDGRFGLYKEIGTFFAPGQIKGKNEKDKVAAIIPAYNEGVNISRVLAVLAETKILDEIIVVDDGSSDGTAEEVKKFERVKLLKNKNNKGKAYAMQLGVEATDADILFFCDADLKGLTPEIVEQIIGPVIKRQYDMYIGIRNNVMQKAVTLFSLNSGERALWRELWNKLPENFKFRYRIEAGLNFIAQSQGNGYGWQQFDYYQTLKEKKYGFLKGALLRWWMNMDVSYAYLLVILSRSKANIIKLFS